MAKRGKQKPKGKASPPVVTPVAKQAAEHVAEQVADLSAEAEQAAAHDIEPVAQDAAPATEQVDVVAAPAEVFAAVIDDTPASAAADTEQATAQEPAPEAAPAPVVVKKPKRARRTPARPREQRPAFLVLADYEQRSLAHIAGLPEQLDAPGLWRGVAYRVGSHRLASGFDEVIEILPMPALTHVPGSQAWMLGVANIRGTLLPVVDLKQFLEGERTVLHERQRVLVMRQPGGDVAIIIDELYGQRSFVDAQGITSEAVNEGRYEHFIDRAYRMNDQDWGVFSFERLARTPEFRQAAA
jgi:twitching motility protein PilI